MRNIVCLTLAAFVLTACQTAQNIHTARSPTNVSPRTPLTVMSYNIRMGVGSQRESGGIYHMPHGKNIQGVIDEIRLVDPDVIGLQEVSGASQAREIGKALNMNYAYEGHDTTRSSGSWWGVAILSKYPILKSRGVDISFSAGDQRAIIVATLDMGSRPATFVSVHKDKDLTDGDSIERILDVVSKIDGPITLIGDFNITPTGSNGRLEMITKRFVDTSSAVDTKGAEDVRNGGTFYYSGRHIDYVFSDPRYFTVEDVGATRQSTPASDHYSYFAKLRWK